MDFSPAVGILHSFTPRGSPSPPAVSGDDGFNKLPNLFLEQYLHTPQKTVSIMKEPKFILRLRTIITSAVARIDPVTILISCLGILIAYYVGIYATGKIHSASRWMGAMLSCTAVVTVLQIPTYKEALLPAWMRVFGTFLGALIAYIYLKLLPFSVVGMLLTVFILEALCMLLNIYNNGRIATITLVIIMLVSQMPGEISPASNALLRFFESAVGVGVGVALRWVIERWQRVRQRWLHRGQNEDGTPLNMDTMPLRLGHFRVLLVASMGQFIGGALATLVGVVIPLMQILSNASLSPLMQGVLASMSLTGIMVGSIIIGRWSDKRGYLRYLRLSPALILLGAILAIASTNHILLSIALFIMGFGVGGGYSLDSDYISEIMPRRWRLFMVGVAKATSAVGNIIIAFVCFYILKHWTTSDHWNGLFILIALLAIVMLLGSIRFEQSPAWLLSQGKIEEAQHAVRYFLGQDVEIGEITEKASSSAQGGWQNMLRGENLRRTLFCGVPWACEGYAVYGVGVFLPVLIMALGLSHGEIGTIAHTTSSVELTAYINLFVAAGFILGLLIVRRSSHTRQQTWGFLLSAIGLTLLIIGYIFHLPHWTIIVGLIIFFLFLNAGPHLITFILPPQIYPIADRGAGAGLAAAMGKAGAIAGVFTIPLLKSWGGVELVMAVTLALQLLGAAVTATLGKMLLPQGSHPWHFKAINSSEDDASEPTTN